MPVSKAQLYARVGPLKNPAYRCNSTAKMSSVDEKPGNSTRFADRLIPVWGDWTKWSNSDHPSANPAGIAGAELPNLRTWQIRWAKGFCDWPEAWSGLTAGQRAIGNALVHV